MCLCWREWQDVCCDKIGNRRARVILLRLASMKPLRNKDNWVSWGPYEIHGFLFASWGSAGIKDTPPSSPTPLIPLNDPQPVMAPKRMPSVFRKSTKEVCLHRVLVLNFSSHLFFLSRDPMIVPVTLRRRLKIKAQRPLKSSETSENRLGIAAGYNA